MPLPLLFSLIVRSRRLRSSFRNFLKISVKVEGKRVRFSGCPTRRANKFLLYIDNGSGGPYVADINNEGASRGIRRHTALPFFHIRKFNFDNACQKVRLGDGRFISSLWSSSIIARVSSPVLQFVSPSSRSSRTLLFYFSHFSCIIVNDLRPERYERSDMRC